MTRSRSTRLALFVGLLSALVVGIVVWTAVGPKEEAPRLTASAADRAGTARGTDLVAREEDSVAPADGGEKEERTQVSAQSAEQSVAPPARAMPHSLRVRLTDPSGLPLDGISVQLVPLGPTRGGAEGRVTGAQEGGEPGEPGIAHWSPFQGGLPMEVHASEVPIALQLVPLLPGLGFEVPPLDVPVPWPEEPLEYRLPEGGSRLTVPLRVEVVHADGKPAANVPVVLLMTPTEAALGNTAEREVGRADDAGVLHIARGPWLGPMGGLAQWNWLA